MCNFAPALPTKLKCEWLRKILLVNKISVCAIFGNVQEPSSLLEPVYSTMTALSLQNTFNLWEKN